MRRGHARTEPAEVWRDADRNSAGAKASLRCLRMCRFHGRKPSSCPDALDLVQASGNSGWSVDVEWAEIEAFVTLMLEMDVPKNDLEALGRCSP